MDEVKANAKFQNLTDKESDWILDNLEKYITRKIYERYFLLNNFKEFSRKK